MFNRLLNKITDSNKSSPSRNESLNGTEELASPEDASADIATEGFLCPSCMLGFPSPETLQDHYETSHVNNEGGDSRDGGSMSLHVCSACRMRLKSALELESHFNRHHTPSNKQDEAITPATLRQELDELRTTLKEERWYSDELKKEVSRLQTTLEFDNSDKKSEVEVFYKDQLRLIEESKQLALSEVVLLKEHLQDSRDELNRLRQDKDKLEQKAATMAGEVASLKSQLDETSGERFEFQSQLKESQRKIGELQVEVEQRLGSEDALLLRQELVTVQNLMDQLTLEKELEKDKLQTKCDSLEAERASLTSALMEATDSAETDRLRVRGAELEGSLSRATEKLVQFEESLRKSHCQAEELTSRARSLEEERQKLAISVDDKNQEVNDKTNLILELQSEVKRNQDNLLKKELAVGELSEQLETRVSKMMELEMQLAESESLNSKSESGREKLFEQVERLEAERKDLYQKIEVGDGAKTVIQQLQQENCDLQEQLLKLKVVNEESMSSAKKKMEELKGELKLKMEKELKKEKETKKREEDHQQTLNDLHRKVKELNDRITFKEKEFVLVKEKNAADLLTSEQKLLVVNKSFAETKHELKSVDSRNKDLHGQLESLNDQLRKERSKVTEVEGRLVVLKQTNEQKGQQLEEAKNNLTNAGQRLQQVQETLGTLQQDNQM